MSCERCEELRLRAESAEARINSLSGVTREQLAAREYERGLMEGKALRDELVAALQAADYRLGEVSNYLGPFDHKLMFDQLSATIRRVRAVLAKAGGAR